MPQMHGRSQDLPFLHFLYMQCFLTFAYLLSIAMQGI